MLIPISPAFVLFPPLVINPRVFHPCLVKVPCVYKSVCSVLSLPGRCVFVLFGFLPVLDLFAFCLAVHGFGCSSNLPLSS